MPPFFPINGWIMGARCSPGLSDIWSDLPDSQRFRLGWCPDREGKVLGDSGAASTILIYLSNGISHVDT
jgi:hypothetical protein